MSSHVLTVRDDLTFAAPVRRVEVTMIARTAAAERVLDPGAPAWEPGASTALPSDEPWAQGAMFEQAGFLFPVPATATRITRELGPEGELAVARFLDRSGKVVSQVAVERDLHGRLTAIVQTNDGDAAAEVRCSYDDAHSEVVTTLSLAGVAVCRKTRTIDGQGLVEREEETAPDGTRRVVRYLHTLNDRGDWIERAAYIDGAGDPAVITRRRIEYRE